MAFLVLPLLPPKAIGTLIIGPAARWGPFDAGAQSVAEWPLPKSDPGSLRHAIGFLPGHVFASAFHSNDV